MTGGSCTITIPETALAVGSHPNLVALYQGNINHLASTSAPLAPVQSVAPKALTIANAAALDKYYDGTTTASVSGTLAGVENGDSVTLIPTGVFASTNPGTNIAVTSTSTLTGPSAASYTLSQPAGLTADIIAASIWTGGVGNTGTNLATGTNYSPTATPTNPYNAIFNGTDPATTDLTLANAIGGGVGTSGMVLGFTGNQGNPVTITGSTGASARIASIMVAPGAGAVTFQGALPFTLGGPSTNTSHSFVNESANPLVFQNTGNWGPGGSGSIQRAMLFSGAGNITVSSNIVPATPSRMSLTKSGSGTLTLSGSNTFSGGTTIHEGEITATTSSALGAGAVVNHGTLDLTAGAVTYSGLSSSLSGTGEVNVTLGNGSASTLLNGNYSNFTGTWNLGIGAAPGAGKVQMNGPDHPSATIRVLENATLYTTSGTHQADLVLYGGNTGESLGQLRIEGSATWAGDITLAGPITGIGDGHIGANSGTGTISGNIGETGGAQGLVKDGDGTIVLTGSNTFTGTTAVNDGVLLVDSPGSLAGAVTVASGAAFGGSGTVAGGITVDAGGTLDPGRSGPVTLTVQGPFSLAGTTQFRANRSGFPNCGRILSTGSIAFGGTLKVINEGPALKLGDQLQLFTAPSFSGTFFSLLLPPLGYDLMWDTSTLATNGSIRVASAASQDHPVITLTPGTFHQQMYGIGGNFCQGEQGTLVGYNRFDEMFGADGLNMSFIRLSTAHELAEPGFASFDANNVTTIQQFRARQPNGRVMLTTWTPPESLKSTNSPYQGTLAKTAGGQYRYADYAAWWTRALQFYQSNAVLPDYVSIQNECDFTPTPPSSGPIAAYLAGCYLNATETSTRAGYPQALAAVRSAFAAAGLGSMKMIGPDTTAIAGDKVKNYLDNIPSGHIDAIAHHLYHDSPGSTGIADLTRLNTLYPYWVMPKFMTELNPHDTYEDWDPAQPGWMQLAVTMHNVFTYERANTYMVWSSMFGFIDRFTGKPNNANYYALGHFSRFVNANNWRVAATSNDPDIAVTHYRHYGGPGISDRQIIVMINQSAEVKHTTVGTSASWSPTSAQRSWQVHQTANDGSASKRLTLTEIDQGPWLSGNRQLVLPPYSITTALVNTGTAASEYTHQQVWRFQHFGTMDNTGNAADNLDSNNDGESNFYEFATGQNPFDSTRMSPGLTRNGANLEFTYTRSKAAVLDGVTFTVESSETLAAGSWTPATAPETLIAETPTTQTLRVLLPVNTPRTFLRLKVEP
jgi:autotransporter-associated beta strand protein